MQCVICKCYCYGLLHKKIIDCNNVDELKYVGKSIHPMALDPKSGLGLLP
jgi:hypothetical protein